jgi:hypothetical protein
LINTLMLSLYKLWNAPLVRPVPPRPVEAMTGLDEQRLGWYRAWPTGRIARDLEPVLERLLEGGPVYPFDQQQVRLAGITWWEREHRC